MHRQAFRPSYGRSSRLTYRTVGKSGSYKRVGSRQSPTYLVPKRYQGISLMQSSSSPEKKSVDTLFIDNATLIPASNAFSVATLLNGVAQGTNTNERIGRKATFKSLVYRIQYSAADGSGASLQPLRVLVVYDRQPNGALALNTDVIGVATFVGLTALANSDRFVIISDQIHQSDFSTPTTGKAFRKMSLETVYGLTTAVIGAVNSGAILVFFAQAGSAQITFNAHFRLRYIDA